MSSEKSSSKQSDDQSAIIIGIVGFGGKWSKFARETAPLGAHHLHSSENLWAGLILHGVQESFIRLFSSVGSIEQASYELWVNFRFAGSCPGLASCVLLIWGSPLMSQTASMVNCVQYACLK